MKISLIVPCRNEVASIDSFLDSALAQRLHSPEDALDVVVADGASDDGTRARLDLRAAADPRLRVVDNPARITPAGLNAAIAAAAGEVIVRMDVHTTYAPDYVAQCVATLHRTGAVCVGGAWNPIGCGWPQASIAAAFRSRFGSGGARSRNLALDGPVDTVYLGAWKRSDLLRLGGFDEHFVRNQDDELALRVVRSGGVVWQSPTIRSFYAPRASFWALARQFYQYGYWKVAVIRKHRLPAAPRHLVPAVFLALITCLTLGALCVPGLGWPLLAVLSAYALLCAVASWLEGAPGMTGRDRLGIALALVCMHLGYGWGFLRALLALVGARQAPPVSATRLTR